MANTSNIGLAKLEGTEKLKTFPTTFNSDMDTIDTVVGNDVGTSRTISQAITRAEEGIAIVANGNTHSAISSGQYVYVKNHGSLAEGLYTASSNISANATLSGSNLTAVSGGGLNSVYSALNSKIASLLKSKNVSGTTDSSGYISLGLSTFQVPVYVTGASQARFQRFACGSNTAWGGFAICDVNNTSVNFVCWYLDFASG